MKRFLAALLVGLIWASIAWAVCGDGASTCFWIAGTGNMDFATDSAHWSNATGGAANNCGAGSSPCDPVAGDSITLNASSGGGTATLTADSPVLGTINLGASTTGFTTSTHNLTAAIFNNSGSGTRTITIASTSTITITGTTGTILDISTQSNCTCTYLANWTFAPGTITGSTTITIANRSLGTFTFSDQGNNQFGTTLTHTGATIAGLVMHGYHNLTTTSGQTLTITNSITDLNGTTGKLITIGSGTSGSATTWHLSAAPSGNCCSWAVIRDLTANTNSITFNNSFSSGGIGANVTINNPVLTSTGGSYIIQ